MNNDDKLIEELDTILGKVYAAGFKSELTCITDISKEIVKLVRDSEWISVDAEHPEEDGNYLVYSPEYYGVCLMLFHEKKWWADESSPTSGNSHWCNIPSPPNKKGE